MLRITVLLFLLGLCLSSAIYAQDQPVPEKYLDIRGISELEMEPLGRATVNLYEGTVKIKTIQTSSDGSFAFRLDINKQYTIEIEKEGLISKRISFNTQMPDEEKGTWMNEFSVGLIRPCAGMDYTVLKQPVDQVKFDSKKREFISDKEYASSMRSKVESLMIRNEQCLLESYESIIKKGDQSASQKKYEEAINIYKEAQKIFPKEEIPARRIAEMNAMINKQQSTSDLYQKLIAEADGLSAAGKMTDALAKYKQASAMNPSDSNLAGKIAQIESELKKQQTAQQMLQSMDDRFNQAMAKASVAYTRKDYAAARTFYQEALDIKPGQSLPMTRIKEIETIQAQKAAEDAAKATEKAKKESFEKEYLNTIAQADALFKEKKFDEARQVYAKAMTMKPSESYPAQRVKTIENAKAAEQANLLKSQEDDYNAAMAAANNALAREQFELAKESYRKALTIKPDDVTARSKLSQVDQLVDAFNKRKSRDEQYANYVQSGDAMLEKKEYSGAKESYTQALMLKPGDKYVQTKITAVDNLVATEQAILQKQKAEAYNRYLADGNTALAQNQFPQAKELFGKALLERPDDLLAKSKLAETDRLSEAYLKQRSIDEQYKKMIQIADEQMAGKAYSGAKESYGKAIQLKPGDKYAQSKIISIDNIVAAEQAAKLKATEEQYQAAIGAANTAIAQKSFPQAKEFLQKALTHKPGDVYASSRIADVDRMVEEQQRKLAEDQRLSAQYKELISTADKYLVEKDYDNARLFYNKALQIRPADGYASQKLASVENLVAAEQALKQKQTDEAFKNAMDQGSAALSAKEYSKALIAFKQALAIIPGNTNARQKISETEALVRLEQERMQAEQIRKKKYDEVIKVADQYFQAKNYANAKSSYETAQDVMPGDTYSRQRIDESAKLMAEIEKRIADEKARDNTYNMALSNGEKFFAAKDFVQAKNEYNRALQLKPAESYPKSRIAEIDKIIAQREKDLADTKARTEGYTIAINTGNAAFERKDYPAAKTAYTNALKFMPSDALASDQIKKIDYLIAEGERVKKVEQERKAAFDAYIENGNKLFDEGKYPVSKEQYKKALSIDPSSVYAKQRIERIDEIVKKLAQSPVKTTPVNTGSPKVVAAIPMGDINFKTESERQRYLDELKGKYPAGITLEVYKENYKETYRYIVIRDNQAHEFRHIRFTSYNGAQYSVNGKPITQQYFDSQTKVREGESFKEIQMQ